MPALNRPKNNICIYFLPIFAKRLLLIKLKKNFPFFYSCSLSYHFINLLNIKQMDKNFLKLIPLSLLAILIASSCAQKDSPSQTNNSVRNRVYASEAEEAKALLLSVEELRQMPKEIRIKRAAALALKNYAFYKDSVFYLNISKEDAKKLGVDEDLYEEIIEGIKDTNKQIKECNAKGEKIIIDTAEVDNISSKKKHG